MNTSYYVKISPAPSQSLTLRAPDGRKATLKDFWRVELLTPPSGGKPLASYVLGEAEAVREAQQCVEAWRSRGVEVEFLREGR